MPSRTLLATTLVVSASFLQGCHAQALSRTQQWQADLQILATEFPRHQIDPWGRLPQAEWHDAMRKLAALPIDNLSDADIAARIEHVLARYHDGHITVLTDESAAEPPFLPIRLRWFPDGIFVTLATDTRLRGAQLIRLGNTDASDLLPRIAPWVSIENDSGLHAAAYTALSNVALLATAGIVAEDQPVPVLLRLRSGEQTSISLAPRLYRNIQWPEFSNLPLYRQSRIRDNWLETVGPHALYLRYAACRDKDGNRALAQQMEAALKTDASLRILVDLRGNSGGDSAVFAPILHALKQSGVGPQHRLRVLLDRTTFSSAFRNAVELRELGATLIGESSSQRPVYTGNVDSFTLPNSRLRIRYTTKWSRLGPPDASELAPDVLIQPTPDQYYRGDDPVLDAAMALPSEKIMR